MAEHWPCWCMRESSMKDMLVAGQTTVRVFRRTCCWLAERRPVLSEGYVGGWRRGDDKNERIIDEGHVGGWPNNGQSFPKDMLLAGRTTASAFRRICWWLAKGYVGGWPNNAQSFSKDWRGSSSFSRASREWDAERGIGLLCVEGTDNKTGP